jgi:hypothetical protein
MRNYIYIRCLLQHSTEYCLSPCKLLLSERYLTEYCLAVSEYLEKELECPSISLGFLAVDIATQAPCFGIKPPGYNSPLEHHCEFILRLVRTQNVTLFWNNSHMLPHSIYIHYYMSLIIILLN